MRIFGTDSQPHEGAAAAESGPASRAIQPPGAVPVRGPSARIARLEAQVAALEAEKKKLATERDILRQAAEYFAGETNW